MIGSRGIFQPLIKRIVKGRVGYFFILPQFVLFFSLMIYPILSGIWLSLFRITPSRQTFVGLGIMSNYSSTRTL